MIEDIEDLAKSLDGTYESRDRKADFKVRKRNRKLKGVERKSKTRSTADEGSDCEVEFAHEAQSSLPGRQSIFVKTYGCSHNISDSEFMMG